MSMDIVVFDAAALIARDVASLPAEKRGKAYAAFLAALARVLNVEPAGAPSVADTKGAGAIATGYAEVEKDVQKIEDESKIKEGDETQVLKKSDIARALAEARKEAAASGAADTKATPDGAQSAGEDTPLDYLKDVAPTLNKLAKANRDGLIAIFAAHGAKKGADLKPEQFRGVLDAATKALAEAA